MSIHKGFDPTGFELQDALLAAVGDPVGDDLDLLEPESLQQLICDHPISDVRRFMNDHRVPARKVDLTAARRVLPNVRRERGGTRMRAVRWLTSKAGSLVHNGLVTAVGPDQAKDSHATVDLDEVIADYGTPAVRLSVLAGLGRQSCELDLAMLIVDGRAVAERWRPHLDRLRPIAEAVVAEFREAHEQWPTGEQDASATLTGAGRDGSDRDATDVGSADARAEGLGGDAAGASHAARTHDASHKGHTDDDREQSRNAASSGMRDHQAPEPTGPETKRVDRPLVDGQEHTVETPRGPTLGSGDDHLTATVGTVAPAGASSIEGAALAALDVLEAAASDFAQTLAALRSHLASARRLVRVRPVAPGIVSDDDLDALRAFASGELDDQDAAFLEALGNLAELSSSGEGDADIMAAEEAVRAFPAAQRFRAVVFAAARGRLIPAPVATLDERLLPWLSAGSRLTIQVPVVPPDAPEMAPADTGPDGAQPGGTQSALARTSPAESTPGDGAGIGVAEPQPPAAAGSEPSAGQPDHGPEARPAEQPALPADKTQPDAVGPAATGPVIGTPSSLAAADNVEGAPSVRKEVTPAPAAAGQAPAEQPDAAVTADEPVTVPADERAPSGVPVIAAPGNETAADVPATDVTPATELAGSPADYDTDYAQMFRSGRWGLARWLAMALGDGARADALEAVAYADAARSATGTLAAALAGKLNALTPQRISGDRPAQILAVAAATRAAIVTPFSDVAPPLTLLARTFDDEAPAVAAIADAAAESARHGVAFTGDIIAALGGAAAVDSKIAEISAEAERQLTRTGRTGYTRADRIWSDWVAPGGPINELLAPVAANDAAVAAAVRAMVFDYGKDSVQQQLVRDFDNRHRGPGKGRLEGPPRGSLLGRLHHAISVASTWLDLLQATAVAGRGNDHQAAVAARLRDTIVTQRPRLDATLDAWSADPDPALAGAAHGASRLYRATFALTEGVPLPGDEQDRAAILDVDLLRTDIPLGPDLTPLDPAAVTPATVAAAVSRSWEDAFASRVAADDHVATAAIVANIAATDPDATPALAARRADALADAHLRVARRAQELSTLLQAARRAGRVNEDVAAALAKQIEQAEQPDRDDLGAANAELDAVGAELEDAAAVEAATFRERLSEAAASFPAIAAVADRFEALLVERDLATAEELLLQLQEGVTQPTEHHPTVDFGDFFPAVVEHLRDGVTPELIEHARHREVDGPLDFRALSPEAAASAATALQAWRGVAVGERQARKGQALAPAFRALGIEFRGERGTNLPGSNDRVWVDLSGVNRVPQTLVPAFGTYAGDFQRLLLVWKQPGESLLEWVEQDPSERPVLVLYFGTMTGDVRRRIANRLRGRHARPVAIVDDAVIAWAASLGHQTFEVTMRATLPFSAVNPYEPDIAGSVPEEMFYGRIAERSAIMSETGTSLIYGGRRLGKSALLRAAERRFRGVDGQEAIYIDLSPAGIRNTRRPEAVWDLIASRVVDTGIAERPNAKRGELGPFERASTAVRSWLAGADGRRLLLLLDECDDFFDVDADTDFAQTRRLKDLMESTGRRFKVVFAGLHQVARFASYPNQPLAHLGKPLPIGPLAPQYAYNLISKPLTALGWRFESENLVNRALTYCNYTPILLQVFGHTLVEHLHAYRLGVGEPLSVITAADMDAVLGSPSVDQAIRSRFDLTLSLDPRYKLIAYVLALETLSGSDRSTVSTSMNAAALRDECRAWWPEGFAEVGNDEFRALLEELVGLGVLSPARGAWQMRSSNVLRLLGTRAAIERGLEDLVEENPMTGGLFSGEAHRRVEPSGAEAVRSPFTEQQLADVIGEGRYQLRVIVGTEATGADDVRATLTGTRDLLARWDLVTPKSALAFERAVADIPTRTHRVVFSDLRGVSDESVARTVAAAAKHPAKPGATCSAVLLIHPAMLQLVEGAVRDVGMEDAEIVQLRRYSVQALRAWAVEVESGFTDDSARRRLLAVTGGWPILVAEAERLARDSNAYRALAEIEASLPGRAEWFLQQVGLDDPVLASSWQTALEVLGETREPAESLAPFLSDDGADGEELVRMLVAAGVIDDRDGFLSVEPVTVEAWRHRQLPLDESGRLAR